MLLVALITPLVGAMLLAVIVTAIHRRLPPVVAARVAIVTVGIVLVAAVPTVWIVSLGYLAHTPILNGPLEWCAKVLGIHEPIPTWAGLSAISLTALGIVRARSVFKRYRQLRENRIGPAEVADHDHPFAVTLPGRAGRVVMSTGLVDLLDHDEQSVVLAHEHAHGRYRHDRYLLIANLAEAVMPLVRPLVRRLQFSLERWADEAAVADCGDRTFVARTLGKVAMRNVRPAGALGFAGLGVPARVAALLNPPPPRPRTTVTVALWSTVAATAGLAVFQLHHLGDLVLALCTA
jgi:Zn-dependent protease with chaperone function